MAKGREKIMSNPDKTRMKGAIKVEVVYDPNAGDAALQNAYRLFARFLLEGVDSKDKCENGGAGVGES